MKTKHKNETPPLLQCALSLCVRVCLPRERERERQIEREQEQERESGQQQQQQQQSEKVDRSCVSLWGSLDVNVGVD